MVDRINNNYTNPYAYNPSKSKKIENDPPAFLLDYDEKGVIYEKSDDKSPDKKEKKTSVQLSSGTFSDSKDDKAYKTAENKSEENETDYFQVMKDVFLKVIDSTRNLFKALFKFIWYGDDTEKQNNEAVTEENVEINEGMEKSQSQDNADTVLKASDEKEKEPRILSLKGERDAAYLAKVNQAKSGVQGIPARNTDLLTTYDRHGKIVALEPSDAQKILKGDKSLKL